MRHRANAQSGASRACPFGAMPLLLPTTCGELNAFLRGSTCWGNRERSPRALLLPTSYLTSHPRLHCCRQLIPLWQLYGFTGGS